MNRDFGTVLLCSLVVTGSDFDPKGLGCIATKMPSIMVQLAVTCKEPFCPTGVTAQLT